MMRPGSGRSSSRPSTAEGGAAVPMVDAEPSDVRVLPAPPGAGLYIPAPEKMVTSTDMVDSEPCVARKLASPMVSLDGKSSISVELHPMPEGDLDPAAEEPHEQHAAPVAPIIPAAPKPKRQILMLPSVF